MNRDLFSHLYSQEEYRPVIWAIINEILTDTQRKYFIDYYIKKEKQQYIAEKYGIHQSVVSKTIGRAGDTVNKIFQIFLKVQK